MFIKIINRFFGYICRPTNTLIKMSVCHIKVCSIRVIFESEIVKDFLCLTPGSVQFGSPQSSSSQQNTSSSSQQQKQQQQQQQNSMKNNNEIEEDNETQTNNKHHHHNNNISIKNGGHNGETMSSSSSSNGGDSSTSSHRKSVACDDEKSSATITNGTTTMTPSSDTTTVDLKVYLPDKSMQTIRIKRNATADEVYKVHITNFNHLFVLFVNLISLLFIDVGRKDQFEGRFGQVFLSIRSYR